jgi:hypothetical protein
VIFLHTPIAACNTTVGSNQNWQDQKFAILLVIMDMGLQILRLARLGLN